MKTHAQVLQNIKSSMTKCVNSGLKKIYETKNQQSDSVPEQCRQINCEML